MKKLHPLDISWDVFVILACIAIPTVCSWLFFDEFPVQGAKSDTIDRHSIGWLGAGTIGYPVSYISLLVGYPDSKKEYLPSWWWDAKFVCYPFFIRSKFDKNRSQHNGNITKQNTGAGIQKSERG